MFIIRKSVNRMKNIVVTGKLQCPLFRAIYIVQRYIHTLLYCTMQILILWGGGCDGVPRLEDLFQRLFLCNDLFI